MGSAEFEPVENALSGISISIVVVCVVACIAWYEGCMGLRVERIELTRMQDGR
jgi:hypothetical protein